MPPKCADAIRVDVVEMDLNPVVLSVLRLFNMLQSGLFDAQRELWVPDGLSSRSLTMLSLIGRGLDRPHMLAEYFDALPSTISFETNKLCKAGLVRRDSRVGDMRTVILRLTPEGEDRNARLNSVVNDYVLQRISCLAPGEFAAFLATARKLAAKDDAALKILDELVPESLLDTAAS